MNRRLPMPLTSTAGAYGIFSASSGFGWTVLIIILPSTGLGDTARLCSNAGVIPPADFLRPWWRHAIAPDPQPSSLPLYGIPRGDPSIQFEAAAVIHCARSKNIANVEGFSLGGV